MTHTLDTTMLSLRAFGDPRKAIPEDKGDMRPVILGDLFGIARRIGTRLDANGDETHPIMGNFEAIPVKAQDRTVAKEKVQVTRLVAETLTLPDTILVALTQAMGYDDAPDEGTFKPIPVQFKARVAVIRNPSAKLGFVYSFDFVVPIGRADPLATLRETAALDVEQTETTPAQLRKGKSAQSEAA